MADSFEEQQRILDPHRLEEQRRAREETEDRLRDAATDRLRHRHRA